MALVPAERHVGVDRFRAGPLQEAAGIDPVPGGIAEDGQGDSFQVHRTSVRTGSMDSGDILPGLGFGLGFGPGRITQIGW